MLMAPAPDDLPKANLGTARGTKDENMVGGTCSIRGFFDLGYSTRIVSWVKSVDGVVEKDEVDGRCCGLSSACPRIYLSFN
jgi:hypothetical protein